MKLARRSVAVLVLFCLLANLFAVSAAAQTALAITKQPESVFVENEGDYGLVTVEAVGDGLTYQWYLRDKGKTSFSASSVKKSSIGYNVTEARDGREVYCVITDAYGNSVRTQTVAFSILRGLTITKQPEDVYVENEGDYGSVTVEAQGAGLTYQWYLKDKNKTTFSLSSVKTNKIGYAVTEARDGREVYCVITDAEGNSVQSDTVMFCIRGVLAIVKQPENARVEKSGDYGKITVVARGEGLSYKWYLRNRGATNFSVSSITSNTIGYAIDETRDGREVYCVITDANGNSVQSNTAVFSIRRDLAITKQPEDAMVSVAGERGTITVEAEGEGLTYQWYLKDKNATKFTPSTVTSNSIGYPVTEARNGRQVYCVVSDMYGNSLQSDVATFSIKKDLAITKQPEDAKVAAAGERGTITVEAEGEGLTYQWYLKDKNATKFTPSSITSNSIGYPVTEARNGRQVYCVVSDMYGNSVQSDVATFSIAVPVIITKQPEDAVVENVGERGTITVEAEGDGLTYQWYLKDKNATKFSLSSITSASIGYPVTEARDGRQVYCVVTDCYGNTVQSGVATFSIRKGVAITEQPQSVIVPNAGVYASATVTARGEGLTYQWYTKDVGKTKFSPSSITSNKIGYSMTEARDGRQLYCVVTDAYGNSATTDIIMFGILGAVTGLTAEAEGDAKVNLQWNAAANASAYDVYYKTGDNDYALAGTSDAAAFTVEGLAANTQYSFRVQPAAVSNGSRITAAFSEEATAKTYCSASGAHVPADAVYEDETPSPSCTEQGSRFEVVYCAVCGEQLLKTLQLLDPLPHTPGEAVEENREESTCSKLGSYDLVTYCTVCSAEVERNPMVLPKAPHTPGDPARENETAATCSAAGSYDEVFYCTVCEEEISRETKAIDPLPHTPAEEPVIENEVAGNCVTPATHDEVTVCSVCGAEISRVNVATETDPTNHVGGTERQNVIEATCFSPGNTGALCCAGCKEIFELGQPTPVDPSNHAKDDEGNMMTELRNVRAATCAQAGYTGDVCCVYCDQVVTAGSSVPALAHTFETLAAVPATCGESGLTAGRRCTVCGALDPAQSVVPATGQHNLVKHLKKTVSDCTEMGYAQTNWECSICHRYYADQYGNTELSADQVEKRGSHTPSQVQSEEALCTPATCQKAATYYYTCSKCHEVLPASVRTPFSAGNNTGHNYVADFNRVASAPTCNGDGSYYKSCSYCGNQSDLVEYVDGSRLGHDYSVFVSRDKEPTCSLTGKDTYKCSRCNSTTEITVPKDPDAHPEGSINSKMTGVISPTCTAPGEFYISEVCGACGKIIRQNEYHRVDPLPHSTYTVPAKAATCTADGNTIYYVCNNCGRLFRDAAATQQITKADTVVQKLGHRNAGNYVKVYSRETTCTVDGLYNMVCYCANGCGTVMDTQPQQTEARFNHMQNGVSAVTDVPAAAATCTEPAHTAGTRCTLCGAVMSGLASTGSPLGHDFSIQNCPLGAGVNGFYCSRCDALNPNLLGTYNTMVNAFKLTGPNNYNYNHTVVTFGKAVTDSNYTRFKTTGIVNILPDVKDQFDSEMRKTETDYSPLYLSGWIRSLLYLKNDTDYVSRLENGDATVTVQRLNNGINSNNIIDSSFPNSFKATNGANYDISRYRNIAVSEPVIAVTVTVKQETYTPAGGMSGVSANQLTALQKFVGKDVREIAAQYGPNGVMEESESDTGYSMTSRMALKSIVSNGNATYYFRASDYEPIAAVYRTSVVTKQDVSMQITLGISSGSITVDPYVTESLEEYFLFSGFFPAS